MAINTNQSIAIVLEVELSAKLIKYGLKEVQNLNGANVFYYIPLFLLATGFERLLKCIICLHHYKLNNTFPPRSIFPKGVRGHNLKYLLDKITSECFSENYLSDISAAKADINFIKENPELRNFMQILSDFSQSDRYYNLNVVLDDFNKSKCPDDEFEKLKMFLLEQNPEIEKLIFDPAKSELGYKYLYKNLIIYIERFVRALSRLFTIGKLGQLSKTCSVYYNHFLFLTNDKLGSSDYTTVR